MGTAKYISRRIADFETLSLRPAPRINLSSCRYDVCESAMPVLSHDSAATTMQADLFAAGEFDHRFKYFRYHVSSFNRMFTEMIWSAEWVYCACVQYMQATAATIKLPYQLHLSVCCVHYQRERVPVLGDAVFTSFPGCCCCLNFHC